MRQNITTTDFFYKNLFFSSQKTNRRKSILMIDSSDIKLWFLEQTWTPTW